MADFVQTTVNKTAVRDLAVPIASVTSFNNLIQSVIDDNPFGCVGYTGADGQPVAAVVRNREHYTAKVNFLDGEGKRVGTVSLQSPTIAAFEANAAEVMGNAALATRRIPLERRTPHLPVLELRSVGTSHSAPAGRDSYATFTQKTVRISSYQDDAIKTTVETWADGIPLLE